MRALRIVCCLVLVLACSPARAEQVSLTLDDALSLALRQNRDLRLQAEEVNRARAAIAEARAAVFPSLDAAGGWTYARSLYGKDAGHYSGQAGVTQLLYAGGKVLSAIKAGREYYLYATASLDAAQQEAVLAVTRSFYALALAREFARLNRGIADNTEEHLRLTRERFHRGEASASDVLALESSLATVRQAYEASLNQTLQAEELLKNLLALDQAVSVLPEAVFACEPRELAFDQALLAAMRLRPEIRRSEAAVNMAESGVAVSKAGTQPSVYASWNYYSSSRVGAGVASGSAPLKGWNDYNLVGLTVSWPLFDGWLTKAKVDQAVSDLKTAQIVREKTVRDIATETVNAYLLLKSAVAGVRSSQDEVKVYADALSVAHQRQREGLVSSLGLADARLGYEVAQFKRTQSVYDYLVAKAQFDKATGGTR